MIVQKTMVKEHQYKFEMENGKIYRTNITIIGNTLNRMKKNYSPIILICGGQRMGKSFVAVWLANKILRVFHDNKPFDISKHTFYDPIEAIRHIQDMEKEPLIIDEAGSLLNKTEWYNKIIRAFDKIIQTQGYKCNCYIFVSPFGSDIAKTFRKHFDFIIYVRRKGVLKVKKIPKIYDDMTGKVPRPYSVEQIKIPKNSVPLNLWNEYEAFSFEKKEDMRERLVLEEEKINHNSDPFGRKIKKGERDVKNSAS